VLVELGQLAGVRAGEDVVAIGSALGVLQNSVTRGIVSAVRSSGPVMLIQTDAAINPGNSGGPLLDRRGVVIGINTMGVRDAQGISFAVGVDHARELLGGKHVATTDSSLILTLNGSLQSTPEASGDAKPTAVHAFESALADAGKRADQMDADWRRFTSDCYEGTIAGKFDRDWFSLFERDKMRGKIGQGCNASFADLVKEANEIKRAVAEAEEAARKGNVYPGVRRDLRQRYHLDYSGWDR